MPARIPVLSIARTMHSYMIALVVNVEFAVVESAAAVMAQCRKYY